MITGLAHTGVCVPDCEAAVAFYRDVLGLRVLSPPYVMTGNAIRDDMGELVSDPSMKAAILGFEDDGDRVLEVIEYLGVESGPPDDGRTLTGRVSRVWLRGVEVTPCDPPRGRLLARGGTELAGDLVGP